MKCQSCGAEGTGRFCEYCGSEFPKERTITNVNNNSKKVINNYYTNSAPPIQTGKPVIAQNTSYQQKEFSTVAIILWLIFLYPVGIILMWATNKFSKRTRIIITVVFCILTLLVGMSPSENENVSPTTNPVTSASPTPASIEYDSLQNAYDAGFNEGLGNTDERTEDIEESIDSIQESIDYIFSE